ncbi:hypothetical protein MKL09_13715 [Methylobacterium sp. J-048]|uniref:hypothetical protein n=1 Tax=Methylobacterium sp. J-048 TaxID=2836635 RepID=UPI001FBA1247|nr:hypothetical protein [Methylobacterium sp. J-048]MCJ2057613.1 hypothetical protein [Methylobacterium sp. J-048]
MTNIENLVATVAGDAELVQKLIVWFAGDARVELGLLNGLLVNPNDAAGDHIAVEQADAFNALDGLHRQAHKASAAVQNNLTAGQRLVIPENLKLTLLN